MKCPYCGNNLYIDNYSFLMRVYVCEDCDRIIYDEDIEDE